MLHSKLFHNMNIDSRFEGRVYQCGRDLIELCCIGATVALCEFTSPDFTSQMTEVPIAECEIQILSGRWKPASHSVITALAAHAMQPATAC